MIATAFTAPASASFSGRADDQTQTQKALASVSGSASDASFASAGSVKVPATTVVHAPAFDSTAPVAELSADLERGNVDPVYAGLLMCRWFYLVSIGINEDRVSPEAACAIDLTQATAVYLKAYFDCLDRSEQRRKSTANDLLLVLRTGRCPQTYVYDTHGELAHKKVLARIYGVPSGPIEIKRAQTETKPVGAGLLSSVRGLFCSGKKVKAGEQSKLRPLHLAPRAVAPLSVASVAIQASSAAPLSVSPSVARSTWVAPAEQSFPRPVIVTSDSSDSLDSIKHLSAFVALRLIHYDDDLKTSSTNSSAELPSPMTSPSSSITSISSIATSSSGASLGHIPTVATSPSSDSVVSAAVVAAPEPKSSVTVKTTPKKPAGRTLYLRGIDVPARCIPRPVREEVGAGPAFVAPSWMVMSDDPFAA